MGLCISLAAVATSHGVSAQTPSPNAKYQIAGLESYTALADAEAKLKSAGYTRQVNNAAFSFDQLVANHVARASGKPVSSTRGSIEYQKWIKGGESISVWYAQAPEGARVKDVLYEATAAVQSFDGVVTALSTRHGRPAYNTRGEAGWCAKLQSANKCEPNQVRIFASGTSGARIRLMSPNGVDEAVRRQVEAAARAAHGGSGSF